MKKNILFVTVASTGIGMGHVMRCLSLATMLKGRYEIEFVIDTDNTHVLNMVKNGGFEAQSARFISGGFNQNLLLTYLKNADVVVTDFYGLMSAVQKEIKKLGKKLVCIDDLREGHFYADVILNVSATVRPNDYICEKYTKLLLGTDYVLLRPEFLEIAVSGPRKLNHIDNVFLNMGGSDEPNNTLKFIKALIKVPDIKQIVVVIGAVSPHKDTIANFVNNTDTEVQIVLYSSIDGVTMKSLLQNCQLAICPASGISMELCAVGIFMISGYTAQNQLAVLQGLIENDCCANLNDFNLITETELVHTVQDFITNSEILHKMVTNQKKMVDGKSGERLKAIFDDLWVN